MYTNTHWTTIIFWMLIISDLCLAENDLVTSREKKPYRGHHHHHHLYYALFSYLAFWVVKLKFVFVVGFFIAITVFAGKLFALLKYTTDVGKRQHHDVVQPQYVIAPSYPHQHYNSLPSDIVHDDFPDHPSKRIYDTSYFPHKRNQRSLF